MLHRRTARRRLRHRDTGRRRQHAGADRGDREADQVHRRSPRAADAGRVHPAHRSGRTTRHRRRRPSGRAVESRSLRSIGLPLWPDSRSFNLRSAFRPTYNMAANLVRTYTSEQAHHLLNLSFAQYQADRDVVRLEARAERLRSSVTEAQADAESNYGDIWEYRAHRAAERPVVGQLRARSGARPASSWRRRSGQPRPLSRPGRDGGERLAQGRDALDGDLRGCRVVARHAPTT